MLFYWVWIEFFFIKNDIGTHKLNYLPNYYFLIKEPLPPFKCIYLSYSQLRSLLENKNGFLPSKLIVESLTLKVVKLMYKFLYVQKVFIVYKSVLDIIIWYGFYFVIYKRHPFL